MQIEASPVVTSAIRCNSNHQILGTEEQARSAGFYSVKYCAKDPVKPKIILPVLHMMDKKRESKHKDAGTGERDAMFWLTRALNNYTSLCEFSDTQVTCALVGIDSFLASHKFWTFHAKSFVRHQRENFEGEMEPVAPDVYDDGVHHALPGDGDVDDDGGEDQCQTIFVTKDKEIKVARQHEHYMRRGDELKKLMPWEWAAMINVEKKRKPKPKSKTLQCNANFEFEDDEIGWDKTHHQVLRSKFVLLKQYTGPPAIPPYDANSAITNVHDRWAQYMGALLFPWGRASEHRTAS